MVANYGSNSFYVVTLFLDREITNLKMFSTSLEAKKNRLSVGSRQLLDFVTKQDQAQLRVDLGLTSQWTLV